MRRILAVAGCLMMIAPLLVTAGEVGAELSKDELQAAHEQLREAVQKIRSYYRAHPHHGRFVFVDEDADVDSDRPRLGVVIEPRDQGVEVIAVSPGGPADEAGIESGDLIVAIQGERLGGAAEPPDEVLINRLHGLEEGDNVLVEYQRGGEPGSATVIVRPIEVDNLIVRKFRFRRPDFEMPEGELFEGHRLLWFPDPWMDMELVALDSDLAEYFGTDEGVLVVRAPKAGGVGLKGGDVIVSIDDRVVKNPTHALRILRSYEPDETMTLEIVRHGRRQTLEATVPE